MFIYSFYLFDYSKLLIKLYLSYFVLLLVYKRTTITMLQNVKISISFYTLNLVYNFMKS